MKDFLKLLTGVALGITLVLSCSDDSPMSADAATCDCAPSEPPLASRVVEVQNVSTLRPANDPLGGRGGDGILCPLGAILLNGGCLAAVGQVPDIVLEQSGPGTSQSGSGRMGWNCSWRNNTNDPVEVRVVANCLMPAQ